MVDSGVKLRVLEEPDAEALAAASGDSSPGTLRWIRALREDYAAGNGLPCAIRVGGETVGYVILELYAHAQGGLHYGLVPAARGKGIATRACALLADHAFRNLGRELLKIDPWADNAPSCAVAERMGFTRYATVTIEDRDGVPRGLARYRLTRAEWEARG